MQKSARLSFYRPVGPETRVRVGSSAAVPQGGPRDGRRHRGRGDGWDARDRN